MTGSLRKTMSASVHNNEKNSLKKDFLSHRKQGGTEGSRGDGATKSERRKGTRRGLQTKDQSIYNLVL